MQNNRQNPDDCQHILLKKQCQQLHLQERVQILKSLYFTHVIKADEFKQMKSIFENCAFRQPDVHVCF